MFKIVCKTPLFTKKNIVLQTKLPVLWNFYVTPKWGPLLNTICQISDPFSEKRGALIPGKCPLNISSQKAGCGCGVGGGGFYFEGGALSGKYGNFLEVFKEFPKNGFQCKKHLLEVVSQAYKLLTYVVLFTIVTKIQLLKISQRQIVSPVGSK